MPKKILTQPVQPEKPAPTEAPDMTKQYRKERRELGARLRGIDRQVKQIRNGFERQAKLMAAACIKDVKVALGSRGALQKRLAIIEGRLSAS